jgi:hypothetical protein
LLVGREDLESGEIESDKIKDGEENIEIAEC